TALIGAPQDNGGVGAAWVFTRIGSEWKQQGDKLVARDEAGFGSFGSDVALSADRDTGRIGGASRGDRGAACGVSRGGPSAGVGAGGSEADRRGRARRCPVRGGRGAVCRRKHGPRRSLERSQRRGRGLGVRAHLLQLAAAGRQADRARRTRSW